MIFEYILGVFEYFMCILGSLVHPKVVKSVHYCPATRKVMERKYTDLTSLEAFPTSAVYPTKVNNKLKVH